jgi:hypothetical protein
MLGLVLTGPLAEHRGSNVFNPTKREWIVNQFALEISTMMHIMSRM